MSKALFIRRLLLSLFVTLAISPISSYSEEHVVVPYSFGKVSSLVVTFRQTGHKHAPTYTNHKIQATAGSQSSSRTYTSPLYSTLVATSNHTITITTTVTTAIASSATRHGNSTTTLSSSSATSSSATPGSSSSTRNSSLPLECPTASDIVWTPTRLNGSDPSWQPYNYNTAPLVFLIWCGVNIPGPLSGVESFNPNVTDFLTLTNSSLGQCIHACAAYTTTTASSPSPFDLCSGVSLDNANTCFLKKGVVLGSDAYKQVQDGPGGQVSAVLLNWQGNTSITQNPTWKFYPN